MSLLTEYKSYTVQTSRGEGWLSHARSLLRDSSTVAAAAAATAPIRSRLLLLLPLKRRLGEAAAASSVAGRGVELFLKRRDGLRFSSEAPRTSVVRLGAEMADLDCETPHTIHTR
jgi:hypothetical protein